MKITRLCAAALIAVVIAGILPLASVGAAEWEVYRGEGGIYYFDGAMHVEGQSGISSVYYTGGVYSYYEMTAELTVLSQGGAGVSSGVVYRTSGDVQGLLLFKTGPSQPNPRALKYATGINYSAENNAVLSSDYTPFEIGERVYLRVVLEKGEHGDVISAWAAVDGKDEGYRPVFEREEIPAVVGSGGHVGFFLARGGIKIDNVHIKNTLTGEEKIMDFDKASDESADGYKIYDKPGTGEAYSGSRISFDGNSGASLSGSFSRMPETIELYFRSSEKATQPLMDNYRNTAVEPNPYRLQITADGKLRYYEMNGDLSFSVLSRRAYCDGSWYRAAVTRSYDAGAGSLSVTLYIFDSRGGILEESRISRPLGERKREDYAARGYFSNITPAYFGTDWFHENYLKGDIGEVFLWDRPLTLEELEAERGSDGLIYRFAHYDTPAGTIICDTLGGSLTAKLERSWIDEVSFFEGDYSILILPDSQRLVKYFPDQVMSLFGWIADNAEAMGIKLVMSVGDLINDKTPEQYAVIGAAAKLIYGKIPFLIIDGNHDYSGGDRSLALYRSTFDTETWREQEGYAGAFEEGSMSNSYYTYDFGEEKYIFLMLELAPRDAVLEWANGILEQHSDRTAIVTTHAHLDVSGTYLNYDKYNTFYAYRAVRDSDTDAQKLWDSLISRHENIKMVFSGHMGCCDIVWRSDRGESGNRVYTFCIDGEKMDSDFGGIGPVVLMTFSEGGRKVDFNYYSVSTNRLIGSKNQFGLTLDSPITYAGCQTGGEGLRLVAALDGLNYEEFGFDAMICSLSDGSCAEKKLSGREVYPAIKSAGGGGASLIGARELGGEYAAALPLELPKDDCLIILTPYVVSDGVRVEGQSIILTRVGGKIHQRLYTGGQK